MVDDKESTNATAHLASEVSHLTFAELPGLVAVAAKQCILDVVGVAIAGAAEPAAKLVTTAVLDDQPKGTSSILGTALTTGAMGAALINGTAAHALDFDDVSAAMCGHPSAPVLPAVLALGEQLAASGAELVTAFVAGFEVECRVGAAVDPSHYERGFHATATVGTIGAAAGAAHLLGLNAPSLEMALGIAVTEASGLKSMFGTMCKPLHAGRAAANGVLAARLAGAGFTSVRDPIGCRQGFADTQADEFDLALATSAFGQPWYVLSSLFKEHAACYFTHSSINALATLRADGLQADDVEQVTLTVDPALFAVCNIDEPKSALEGKFSLRFTAALALTTGTANEDQFTESAVSDPILVALRDRVNVVPDSSLSLYESHVAVLTARGETRTEKFDTSAPRWTADPSEQTPRLVEKFVGLVSPILGLARTRDLAGAILDLENIQDVRTLGALARIPA